MTVYFHVCMTVMGESKKKTLSSSSESWKHVQIYVENALQKNYSSENWLIWSNTIFFPSYFRVTKWVKSESNYCGIIRKSEKVSRMIQKICPRTESWPWYRFLIIQLTYSSGTTLFSSNFNQKICAMGDMCLMCLSTAEMWRERYQNSCKFQLRWTRRVSVCFGSKTIPFFESYTIYLNNIPFYPAPFSSLHAHTHAHFFPF